jgi:hypothetical protein
MNHTESAYIEAGRKYEKAHTIDQARAVAEKLRAMLSSENPKDVPECRRLIDQGRAEGRA